MFAYLRFFFCFLGFMLTLEGRVDESISLSDTVSEASDTLREKGTLEQVRWVVNKKISNNFCTDLSNILFLKSLEMQMTDYRFKSLPMS